MSPSGVQDNKMQATGERRWTKRWEGDMQTDGESGPTWLKHHSRLAYELAGLPLWCARGTVCITVRFAIRASAKG